MNLSFMFEIKNPLNYFSHAGFQTTDSLSNKRNSFVRVSKDWPWTFILVHFNKKIKKYQKALNKIWYLLKHLSSIICFVK